MQKAANFAFSALGTVFANIYVSTRTSGKAAERGGSLNRNIRHIPPDKEEKKMKTLTMYTIHNALSDFNRYFDTFFGDSLLSPAGRILNYSPAVDIQETENSYVMEMELPGFDEKNIEVNVDGSNLTVASKLEEKEEKKSEEDRNYILRERRSTTFNRSFQLPENADPEAVSAAFKNGILSLSIKKRAESQRRMIQINAA